MPRTLLKEPDVIMIIIVSFTLFGGLLLAWLIYALSEKYGWTKRYYTDVDYHKKNLDMSLSDFHSRSADITLETKTHLQGKRIKFEDLSDNEDIAADDLLDYKDQLKVESFNSESLYQILEDELGSTKTLIQDQDVNSTQAGLTERSKVASNNERLENPDKVYYQTQVETESLKMIWKSKMNNLSNQSELTPELIQEYNHEKAKASFQINSTEHSHWLSGQEQ